MSNSGVPTTSPNLPERRNVTTWVATRDDISIRNIIRRLPWKLYTSLMVLLVLLIVPSALLLKLNINNAPKVYLPPDAPSVLVDDKLRRLFPSDQVLLLLFEGVALYSEGFLKAFHELAETIKEDPLIDDVVSITTQDHISGTEDGFIVAPLVDVGSIEQSNPEQRRQRALSDRFANRSLISHAFTATSRNG